MDIMEMEGLDILGQWSVMGRVRKGKSPIIALDRQSILHKARRLIGGNDWS